MKKTSQIILDPYKHQNGVNLFLDYYAIRTQSPGLEFLQSILRHFSKLPYENVSKIIKLNRDFLSPEHIRLPEEVFDDHARFHLGGTCFSLTFFLQSILLQHGFQGYPVIAHMRNRPNVHCAFVVLLDRKQYLVDPGYLLNQPMEIQPDSNRFYRTAHTGVELAFNPDDEFYHLYTFDKQDKKWRYCFQNKPLSEQEFLDHWLNSFYQGTMHGICMTQLREDGMLYLHNNYLRITTIEGQQKQRIKQDYYNVVQNVFGIDSSLVEEAMAAISENMAFEREFGLRAKEKNEAE